MWMKLLLSAITSEMTKQLIGYAIKKLLNSKNDGITKDIIKVIIDGAVESKKNDLKDEDVFHVRNILSI
jgi:hypothetical protein